MSRILFVFLDGVGLGPPADNPLAAASLPSFARLAGDQRWTATASPIATARHVFHPIDATLGIDGLPQSGTGQASLFTGVNCAARVGRHFGPYPHSKTHDVLDARSLFHQVKALSLPDVPSVAFANAYPPRFFEHVEQTGRWPVTTRCCMSADVRIRTIDDLRSGRALTAELTGHAWADQLDLSVDVIDETRAGQRLVALHRRHALTVFEYFLTDKAGHGRIDTPPATILHRLDRFFGALLDALDPATDTLVVTSDHGNVEDARRTTHTRHPVPLLAYGWAAPHFASARTLTDVTPAIVEALRAPSAPG